MGDNTVEYQEITVEVKDGVVDTSNIPNNASFNLDGDASLDMSNSTSVVKTTLTDGNQSVTFNNAGGNIAVISSNATGTKDVTLGDGGDIAVIGNTDATINVKAGKGSDNIVSSGSNVNIDLSAGGSTKVAVNAGTVNLNGYDHTTGAGIRLTNSTSNVADAILNGAVSFNGGAIALSNGAQTGTVNFSSDDTVAVRSSICTIRRAA